jgi:hypothetical protein
MHLLHLRNLVVAVVLLQGASLAEPPTLPVDATSFAVYRAILDVNTTKPVLLQRETTMWPPPFNGCGGSFLAGLSGEWQEAARDFAQKNAHVWLLPAALPFKYEFIRQAEIEAHDAPLREKYRGYNGIPGAVEYAALSAVGFNAAKTKAIVYRRLHDGEDLNTLELLNGQWMRRAGCGGRS